MLTLLGFDFSMYDRVPFSGHEVLSGDSHCLFFSDELQF